MQSSKHNPNQKQQKALIKHSMQSIKKTIVPFNQELLNLQKKIQEVQSKNELILQKIHKAYDFKKNKNKVFYDASEEEVEDEHQAIEQNHQNNPNNQVNQNSQNSQVNQNSQNSQVNLGPKQRASLQYARIQGYSQGQQQVNMREFQSQPRQMHAQQRQFQFQQRQPYPPQARQYAPQPREFHAESSRKQPTRPSLQPVPSLQFAQYYPHPQQQYTQQPLRLSSGPSLGNDFAEDVREQSESQEATSRVEHRDEQQGYTASHLYKYRAEQEEHGIAHSEEESEEGQQFESHSNYSDIEKRKRIGQNFRRREKDFSDIKSTFEDRSNLHVNDKRQRLNKHTPKKSFVFSSVENNSSYSEGNLPNSADLMQADDLEQIQAPVTNHAYYSKPVSPHYQESISIHSQQPRGPQVYSTNDLYPHSYLSQPHAMSSVPNIPLQSMQVHSHFSARPSLPHQTMSHNEIHYLTDMYKTQRQKTLTLQKQIQHKDQNIQHLKFYKKSFKRFRDHTFHLFEEAFDQYVQNFLRNRLYQIQKAMRKNQNRLSALIMQVKDFNDERVLNLSLKKNTIEKLNKRSYSSLEPGHNPRQNIFHERVQDEGFEQNASTISNRSGDRSVSGKQCDNTARKRRSQEKSVTKKSNQSQHMIMKKEFTNIAENYQTMIKVKNEEIEKYESETRQLKATMQMVQEENNRLKTTCQQLQSQLQAQQLQTQLGGSGVEPQLSRRNSGNLRIFSRSSSRTQIKKPSQQQSDQLQEKVKLYAKSIEKLSEENSSLENQLQAIHQEHLSCQEEMKLMAERIFDYEQKVVPLKDEKILALEATVTRMTKECQVMGQKMSEMAAEVEACKVKLAEKDKKILELDSAMYIKSNQLKKVQNLLTLKTYKLQEFNKLLLTPSANEPLNDSMSSAFEQPHNKTTFLMLENLQKQLEQQKQQKQLQFLKLKRSYESKIEQLKIEFQQIVQENQNLSDKLNTINLKQRQTQYEKEELTEINIKLREQIQRLQSEINFLQQKNHFYQAERHTGKTGSFGGNKRKDTVVEHELHHRHQHSQGEHLENDHHQLLKPLEFQEQDFDDFPQIQNSQELKKKDKSLSSWKPVSGEIQLLDQSSYHSGNNEKRSPSQENRVEIKKTTSINYKMQHKLSTIKDENIDLSQKVAKLQRENKYQKETEEELTQKYEDLKSQLTNFAAKYDLLEHNNSELIKMLEQVQADKIELQRERSEMQAHSHQHNQRISLNLSHSVSVPVDWKEVEKHIEPVELKGSGMYSPWSFAEKDDILLDRSERNAENNRQSGEGHGIRDSREGHGNRDSREGHVNRDSREGYGQADKQRQINIRESVVSGFGLMDRPSKQSRESHSSMDKKMEELTKKLSQTQLLLQNKQKINEQLVIGFSRKMDKLTNQYEWQAKQQSKAIQKYIQENSKLRTQVERLEEELQAANASVLRVNSAVNFRDNQLQRCQNNQQNLLEHSQEAEQINLDDNLHEHHSDSADQNCMLQQRIEGFNGRGFMLGLNNDQDEQPPKLSPQKSPQKTVKFASILEEQEDDDLGFEEFEEQSEKVTLLQTQVHDLQETIEQLQKFLQESLNKVKQKQEDKFALVQELQRKNNELEELKDLLELKETGKSHTLTLSKSINYGLPERPSVQKSQRPRLNSITSLRYSRTNHGERKSSFDEDLNFDFLDQSHPNQSILDHSQASAMYSENMSLIFDKEENFLEQVRKAKNKRKEEGKLLRKTFEYIKKLRGSLNEKSKKVKVLQMRVEELRDNCWLWKKGDNQGSNMNNNLKNNSSGVQMTGGQSIQAGNFASNGSNLQPSASPRAQQNDHSYLQQNQSLYQTSKLVDSRLFECNSQDLNKKKPHRHNHYKKLEYDTKLIVEENRILTKQIEMLQEELLKIQEQENGLMAVKELYKEQIRALNKQNQQLTKMYTTQVNKLQDKLQQSEGVHNFQAIKQLFKKIIDNVGVMLYPNMSVEAKKKSPNQLKEEKRKQAEECIKVVCSILNYDQHIRNQLCLRLCAHGQV